MDHASAVEGLKCADLVDAMGRLHRHRCHILDLVSPTPGRVLFGPAVTISYFPSCSASLDPERYNLANLFYDAVGNDPEGKVLVLASDGYTDVSMGGGTKLSRLQRHVSQVCSPTGASATSTSWPDLTLPLIARARRPSGVGAR
jgi:4-hydroxy-4-methyl-2-oxoglutarate aldolase